MGIEATHDDVITARKVLSITITVIGFLLSTLIGLSLYQLREQATQLADLHAGQLITRSHIEGTSKTLATLETTLRGMIDSSARLTKLERDNAIAQLSNRISAVETLSQGVSDNITRVWPRLRAHGENIQIIARELERSVSGANVKLKEPENY